MTELGYVSPEGYGWAYACYEHDGPGRWTLFQPGGQRIEVETPLQVDPVTAIVRGEVTTAH